MRPAPYRRLAPATPPRYSTAMSDDNKPLPPFKLNASRIVLLILGVILLAYIVSAFLGGLTNYEQLKEAAQDAKAQQPAPVTPAIPAPAAPAN